MAELGLAIASLTPILFKIKKGADGLIIFCHDVENIPGEFTELQGRATSLSDKFDELELEAQWWRNIGRPLHFLESDRCYIKNVLKECNAFLDAEPISLKERVTWCLNPINLTTLRGLDERMNTIHIQILHHLNVERYTPFLPRISHIP
jgi:hypothetical protein